LSARTCVWREESTAPTPLGKSRLARSAFGYEPQSRSGLGDEVARPGGVGFELSADRHHEHAQVVGLGVAQPPHFFEELALGHKLAGIAGEDPYDLPLGGRETDVGAVYTPNTLRCEVDSEVGGLDDRGFLGGRYSELAGIDVANAVLEFARREKANQLVLGATRRFRVYELLHGSVINKAIRAAGPVEVHVIPARRLAEHIGPAELPQLPLHRPALPGPRRVVAWLLSVVAPGVITIGLIPVRSSLGLAGALLCSLVAVVGVALLGGVFPAVVATAVAVALSDFYYTAPLHSFRVAHLVDLIALITFGVVAAAVGGLVDLLARRGAQVVRANTEAQNLARFAADLIVAPDDLSEAVRSIRHTFGLDGVALLRRTAGNWEVEAATGDDSVQLPSDAPNSVEIAQDRVLAFSHSRLAEERDTLFGTFLAQLRLAREKVMIHGR